MFVRPFPNVLDGRTQVSVSGGEEPRWSSDGRQLFYAENDPTGDRIMAAHVRTQPTFTVDSIQPLFVWQRGIIQSRDGWLWDAAPDGSRFVAVRYRSEFNVVTGFVLIENFFEQLRAQLKN